MVIRDLDIFGPRRGPAEADPELIVDPDAVLPCSVALQCFEPVSRRDVEIRQATGYLELPEHSPRNRLESCKPGNWMSLCQCLSVPVPKGYDHR